MDNNIFKQRLTEVAEWRTPKIKLTPAEKKKKSGRPSKEEQYQELHEEAFADLFQGQNPTQAPELVKVKRCAELCEDCGKHCENGRHTEKAKYNSSRPHWRKRCVTCGMNQNPFSGEWDLTNKNASAVWAVWLRKTSENSYDHKKIITITPEQFREDK